MTTRCLSPWLGSRTGKEVRGLPGIQNKTEPTEPGKKDLEEGELPDGAPWLRFLVGSFSGALCVQGMQAHLDRVQKRK